DDVQTPRSLTRPALCHRDRVVAVRRLGSEVALQEPDAAAAAQVDRRDHREASHQRSRRRRAHDANALQAGAPAGRAAPRGARTKLRSRARPACWLFSGWNCVAKTLSRATAAVNSSSPWRAVAIASPGSAGTG